MTEQESSKVFSNTAGGGANVDLSSLQSIQGHTVIENTGLNAQEVAGLIGAAGQSASAAFSNTVSGVMNSNTTKILLAAIVGGLAFFIFRATKRR